MGAIGKWFGSIFRRTGRAAVKLWHRLTPMINKTFKVLLKEAGEEGWEIIQRVVASVESSPKGVDKLSLAKKEIEQGFKDAKINMQQKGINLLIEFAVNLL
jgi:hypothetical protein